MPKVLLYVTSPEEVPFTIKEPPAVMFIPSVSVIVKLLISAPVVAPIIGAVAKSGIITLSVADGTVLISQFAAVAQSVFVPPVQVTLFEIHKVVELT